EALGLGQPEPVETYSTSEHLYSSLGIPRDATGTLPTARRDRLGLEAEDLEDIGETGRNRSRSASGTASRDARTRASHGDSARSREPGQRKPRVRRRTRAGVATHDGRSEPAATAETPGAAADGAAPGGRNQPAGRRRRSSRGRGRGGTAGQARGA